MTNRAVLCPKCRRLIGSDETFCSWCGTRKNAFWWRMLSAGQGTSAGGGLVKAIVIANVIFYIVSLLLSRRTGLSLNPLTMLSPDRVSLLLLGATGTLPVEGYGRIWSLLAANYLHGGIFHILFNMMALRQIAPAVLQEFGVSRTFIIYTLGGVSGYIVSVMAGVPFTIGASAAVCALIGALLYFGYSRGGTYGATVFSEVVGWIISLAIFGLLVPGINNWGHGGGVVGGAVLAIMLGYQEARPEKKWQQAIALLCVVSTIIILGWALVSSLILFLRH